jgi:hypothetical protein
MSNAFLDTLAAEEPSTVAPTGMCVGQIIQVTRDGRILVDFPGNPGGLVEARHAGPPLALDSLDADGGVPVLLFLEHGDPRWPIILGVIHDRCEPPVVHSPPPATVEPARDVVVDGQRLMLEATEELVLRCGKSSVTLRKDGKVVIQGMRLVSRATETNRITGGSVAIN